MISALQSARSGMNIATARLNDAAANIVRSTAIASEVAAGAATSTQPSSPPTGTAFADPLPVFGDDISLVNSLVDLKEAEILYKASARVFGAVADSQKSFLDITR